MHSSVSFLNAKNFRPYHVELARKLGCIEAAIFLCELIFQIDRFKEREEEQQKAYIYRRGDLEYVYLTLDDVEMRTAMKRRLQEKAIKKLEEFQLIEKTIRGSPPKRYFRLEERNILRLFNLAYQDKSICTPSTNTPIYKERDIKNEREAQAPPPLFSFAYEGNTFIRMPQEKYDKLVSDHGQEKVLEVMKEITDYVAGGGKNQPKKDHAAYVRNWIRKDQKWNKPKKEEQPPPPVNAALPEPKDETKEEHRKWVVAFMKKFGTRAVTKNKIRVIVNDTTVEFYPDIDKMVMIESVSIYEKNYKKTVLDKMKLWGIETEGL